MARPKEQILYGRLHARCVEADGGCWEWVGCVQNNGYGRINYKRKSQYVHRAMYAAVNGSIPPGMDVCHSCDNRRRIRPAHLFVGTRADNMADAVKKNRQAQGMTLSVKRRGEKCFFSKLTTRDVREIREMLNLGLSTKDIAKKYGVSPDNIRRIRRGDTWKTGFLSLLPPKNATQEPS